MSYRSPIGKRPDPAAEKSSNRKAFRTTTKPIVGRFSALGSMMTPRRSVNMAATFDQPVSSMMGYVVVAGLAIAAVYALTHS